MYRASSKTVLELGLVKAPIVLIKTTEEPKDASWETAGPSGGALRKREVAAEAPPAETPRLDPLAMTGLFEASPAPSVPGKVSSELVEDGTGQVVSKDEIRRGIRAEDGTFIDLTERLNQITEMTMLEAMRIVAFIRVEQVPRDRIVGSYWVAPEDAAGGKVLRLLYEAMKNAHRVAVVRWTKRTRQSLGVIVAHRSGAVMVLEVEWASFFRAPDARILAPLQAEVSQAEVDAATGLILAMADSRIALDELEDEAIVLRRELLAAAREGRVIDLPVAPDTVPVELVETFRRSIEAR